MNEEADDEKREDESWPPILPKSSKSASEIDSSEQQIVQCLKDVRYIVREYPTEVVVQKYIDGKSKDQNEIYVPDYQRELVWPENLQSKFIESLLIGLPIPFIFVADVNDEDEPEKGGRIEIVDGVQRIRTLARFLMNDLVLKDLQKLDLLNGSRFSDLHPSRQRRFRRATLRLIELTEAATEDVRRDIFSRINTGTMSLEFVELRRGMEPGPFLELISDLASDLRLSTLAPVSDDKKKRYEYEELITRFFAYLDRYEQYGRGPQGKQPAKFLHSYVKETNDALKQKGNDYAQELKGQWDQMISFIEKYFPAGFKKSARARSVPRVRFEAISVGSALALKVNPNLQPKDLSWLDSKEFKSWTTSDSSNNRVNLIGRIEYVRNKLLNQ